MSSIIPLNYQASSTYRDELIEICQTLNGMDETLFNRCVHLAFAGPWKKWESEQPIGSTITINTELLMQTADKNILRLLDVRSDVKSLILNIQSELEEGF